MTKNQTCPCCTQTLTSRERQVLSCIKGAYDINHIARSLSLSPKTVSAHKRNAMLKLGFRRNNELYYWLQQDHSNYRVMP
ncbi:helix-turn-helix domain-containing protein [Serratia sarumanii]|uniref:helix-turn-helix domain-containing protein n=1 Tax=Serratia sarumanii TaxID=3020826 RepID=UPI003F7F9C89